MKYNIEKSTAVDVVNWPFAIVTRLFIGNKSLHTDWF